MNKRAFTLVELLAVITILGIIALVVVPSVDSVIKSSKKKVYEKQKDAILTSLQDWLTDNKDVLYKSDSVTLTLADLKEQNYVDYDIKNPSTDKCISNDLQLTVTKVNKKYEYSIVDNELVDGNDDDCDVSKRSPSIYLVGANSVNLEINTTYTDLGYSAKDIDDNDVTSSVVVTNNIDKTKLGSYNVVYKVTANGLTKTKVRTVNVVDTTKPVINVPADSTIYADVTSFDIRQGVTVSDNSGEKLIFTATSNISLGVIGDYQIIYTVTDSSGNTVSKIRNIKIDKKHVLLKKYDIITVKTDDFHSSTYSSKIKTISLINNMAIPATAVVTWDLSAAGDNSIKGWIVTNSSDSTMYDLYIGSYFDIYANPDSSYLFSGLTSVTTINLNNFDTRQMTNMSYMFSNCSALTSLDLSSFNTSKVTNMVAMFSNSSALTSLNLSSFNTSGVTNMLSMFSNCSALTSLNLSSFNTSRVTNMAFMFSRCSALKSLDLSNFNTSEVTNMSYMFSYCSSLTSLDLSNFNTSEVTNMSYMFSYCSSLTSLDLSNFNTSKVTDISYMFNYCSALKSLNLSSFNTSEVTNMAHMFYRCSFLTSLDLSNFNTSGVTDMACMFYYTSKLTTIYVGGGWTTANAKTVNMFEYCGTSSVTLKS